MACDNFFQKVKRSHGMVAGAINFKIKFHTLPEKRLNGF